MRYQRVRWLHDSPEDPVVLYSEIDADPEFEAEAITAAQFEIVWRESTTARDRP